MAKSKKHKGIKADSLRVKKASQKPITKKVNPFDIHQNKEKFKILGRTCKHDHGMPGISRSKALKKRQETLGQEIETYQKTNKFKDYRIGNGVTSEIDDNIANARFTLNKMEQFKKTKKDLFNLNDDELLTHKGSTLAEIEQFEDPVISDDSEDEGLDAKFTENAHFGSGSNIVDRKEAIDDMIAESKRKKAEITKDKDEIYNMTNTLDMNYKNIIPLLGKLSKNSDEIKLPADDYDRALREMIFEPRGEVTDRLQSEEEIAKKEKERLEQLENARLSRMNDVESDEKKPKHRSADDLDDGYLMGSVDEDDSTLAYDMNGENINRHMIEEKDEDKNSEIEEDISENEIEEEENHTTDDSDTSESENDADNLSDLKASDSDSENDEPSVKRKKNICKQAKNEIKKSNKKMNNSNNLHYTYDMPENYLELKNILYDQSPDNRNIIVERIIKCHHPKLDGKNREKIVKLFQYLIEFICEIFNESVEENIENSFKTLNFFTSHIYDIIQLNCETISTQLINILKNKYEEYTKDPKAYPNLGTIILFKMVSNLYSTSDFRHPVVGLCFIFMSHILSQARTRTRRDISTGLLIVTVVLEYTQLSKRFLPAVYNFLQGLIYLAIPKRPIEVIKTIPPFSSSGQYNSILALKSDPLNNILEEKLLANDLVSCEIDENFKILTINTVFKLIKDAIEIFSDNVGVGFLAEPILILTERLNLENYPKFVQTNWSVLEKVLIDSTNRKLQKLIPHVKKPKALRLMEPRIEAVYDDKRRPKMSKEKEMRAILTHKIKRETKGAVREIRRDTQFVQRIKIQKQIQSDIERNEKVRQIYAEAAQQQGELNELSRTKKKGKF